MARHCLTHALRTPEETDMVYAVSYSQASQYYSYAKAKVQQIDKEFVYTVPANLPRGAMDEDQDPSVWERRSCFRVETKATAATAALNNFLQE